MIKVKSLINLLKKNSVNFFSGVPDSVLKQLSSHLQKFDKTKHIISTNEGSAVSIGIGYYLSTNKLPCIYMQNSGLSNALNPLLSIAHKKVYSIPLILVIGWRGSPGKKDEPQHKVKGEITEKILKLLNIKYTVLRSASDLEKFNKQIKFAKKNKSTVACLIERGTLEEIKKKENNNDHYKLNKELFLKNLIESLKKNTKIISSTGYNSRELMYLKKKYKFNNSSAFYMIGGMGHTASVALGYSLTNKSNTVCIDGDGSILMHLGSIKTVGNFADKNFKYVLLNNNCHDSVGGQTTLSKNINFRQLSKSLGFKKYYLINKPKNLRKIIKKFLLEKNLSFLEARVATNKIKDLPRPNNLLEIKKKFMK